MRGVDLALGLSQKFMDILVRYIATHLELHDLDISPGAILNYLIKKISVRWAMFASGHLIHPFDVPITKYQKIEFRVRF